MSVDSCLVSIEGVWISRVTTASHPLDAHVEGIRLRSNDAFRAVHGALADELLSFAFGMLGDRRTAEDVVQQAFVELVRSAHKIRGEGAALRAWLYKSVRYGCLDEYRRRERRPETPTEVLPDSLGGSLVDEQVDPDLERALSELSRKYRAVIVLRHVVGLTGEEIAGIIGTSRKAAYGTISRAEAKLRRALEATS